MNYERTSIAHKRLGPWTAVAVVGHRVGAVPPPEGVGAHRQEEVEPHHYTDSVPASDPGQLTTRGTIRTKNK